MLQAEHIEFVCTDAALARRIERAAQSCGQSLEEFVAYSLGGDVDMWEESMLLHPTTGDLLDTDYEDLYCTVEEKMTVPPMGREDEAQFRMSGTMDLQVHHVVYIACLDPRDYPDELLLVVCDWHHKERQAVEQAIYAEVGKHLATLDIHQMRRQPIYAYFEEDSTLDCFPAWQRELLRYVRDEDDCPVPRGNGEQRSH